MVSDHIQAMPGNNHAAANNQPRAARRRPEGFSPNDVSKRTMPTNASGQIPHGGNESATQIPPPMAMAAEDEKRGTRIVISVRR
jgi:hypothetical protein